MSSGRYMVLLVKRGLTFKTKFCLNFFNNIFLIISIPPSIHHSLFCVTLFIIHSYSVLTSDCRHSHDLKSTSTMTHRPAAADERMLVKNAESHVLYYVKWVKIWISVKFLRWLKCPLEYEKHCLKWKENDLLILMSSP